MLYRRIKNKVDKKLSLFINNLDKTYHLKSISPLLYKSIKDFVLRDGKRIRPLLFLVGYKGFAKKEAPGLYTSALAIELLHDFMLIHDDIIDKSDVRRGKPSMHKLLHQSLAKFKNRKFNGQDMAIVIGDVMYAMAIDAFLVIKEKPRRKEKALKKFIQAAAFTGAGEFIELLNGVKNVGAITKDDIYRIYDFKTAYYTFSAPLATGAILAGASSTQVDKLFKFGIYLGRAFQIKDDTLGMFAKEKTIGKSTLTDLQEAKKTLLIWHAYRNTTRKNKATINKIFSKKKVIISDSLKMRKIIEKSGALDNVKKETAHLIKKGQAQLASSTIRPKYKNMLFRYSRELLSL